MKKLSFFHTPFLYYTAYQRFFTLNLKDEG